MTGNGNRCKPRQDRFYQRTALLNSAGVFQGWVNRDRADHLLDRYSRDIKLAQYNGQPAFQTHRQLRPDPLHVDNRRIVTSSSEASLHHVLPHSGFAVLRERHKFKAFYYTVLLRPDIHQAIEQETQPLYFPELNKAAIAQRSPEHLRLRAQCTLILKRARNLLRYVPAEGLDKTLQLAGWSSVDEIPTFASLKDSNAMRYVQERDSLAAIESRALKEARRKFWLEFSSKHTLKEIKRMFTSPILDRNPEFLPEAFLAEWTNP